MPYITTHIKKEVGLKLYSCSHILDFGTAPRAELPQAAPLVHGSLEGLWAFESYLGGQGASTFHLSTLELSYYVF